MKYRFSAKTLEWLEAQGFDGKEVEVSERLLNKLSNGVGSGPVAPKGAPPKVEAFVHALASLTWPNGVPTCFMEDGKIYIPPEAERRYAEGLEMAGVDVSGVEGGKLGRPKQRDLHRKY